MEYHYNNFDEKITEIIKNAWDECLGGEENVPDDRKIKIWVSYIMCFGFDEEDVIAYAANNGITIVEEEVDPEAPYGVFGTLIITAETINKLNNKNN